MQQVERGIEKIERFLRDRQHPELAEDNAEISVLKEWLKELRLKQPTKPSAPPPPPSPLDQLRKEMEKAVRAEQYERAAELRDAIRAMEQEIRS